MNVKKTIKKIAALGAGVSMVGATLMGAFAYDLANYPAPFVADGVFSGTIVVGEKAATADVIGAVDIAASLQADSVSEEAVDVPGAAGEVSLGENAFRFEASNDLLEIREAMGNIYDSLTDAELPALAGGTITTDEGSTDYDQYLNFAGNDTSEGLQPIGVNYAENKDDLVGDFLIIDNDESFFEWEIVFNEGLESSVESGELVDLENEVFNIFGTEYTFVNSDSTPAGMMTLEFMAGDVSSTLREGETKTFTIDGTEYEVTLIFVSDPSTTGGTNEAKFMVNGEVTDSLTDGETDTLSGGLEIGVRDLLVNSREGVVEFFLGAEKISFTDSNVASSATGEGSVEIGNEEIDDIELSIVGTVSATDAEINSIAYSLEANPIDGSVFYVAPGTGVREYMLEPEALLSPTFDIRYEGLKSVPSTPIEIETSGDDQYEITVTNVQNKEFSWPLINSQDQLFRFGEDADSFVFVEAGFDTTDGGDLGDTTTGAIAAIATQLNTSLGTANASVANASFNIHQDDFFLVSDTAKNEKANSYVLTYDTISTSENTITFSDLDGGKYKVQYTALAGSAAGGVLGYTDKLRIGGNTFNVWILNHEDSDYPVAVDLNNDGFLGRGDRSTFTVKGGAILDFAVAVQNDSTATTDLRTVVGHGLNIDGNADATNDYVNMTLTTLDTEFDTSGLGDETISWQVTAAADDELDISAPVFSEPTYLSGSEKYNLVEFLDEDSGDLSHTYTSYGAYVTLDEPSSSPATFTIDYPESQVGAQVFVVAGTIDRTETGSGVTSSVVNPIAVGMAVLDVDAPAVGSENLIVVGGPCANTVAWELMGEPATCGAGFVPGKALIKSWDNNGKVSILVAGYEAAETTGATRVLANYGDYELSGDEVEVVVAGLNDLTVQAVSANEAAEMAEEAEENETA